MSELETLRQMVFNYVETGQTAHAACYYDRFTDSEVAEGDYYVTRVEVFPGELCGGMYGKDPQHFYVCAKCIRDLTGKEVSEPIYVLMEEHATEAQAMYSAGIMAGCVNVSCGKAGEPMIHPLYRFYMPSL